MADKISDFTKQNFILSYSSRTIAIHSHNKCLVDAIFPIMKELIK